MQAIIMAAGKGSRLGSITEDMPKSFLEIRGTKLIEYNIAMLHANGIREIVVVTGYQHQKMEQLLGGREGVRLIYNPFYEMMNVLGSFYLAQGALEDDEDLAYLHADTLCDPGIFEEMLAAAGDMVLPVDFGPCDGEAMKVRTERGRLVEISKDIPCELGEGEFIGIAKVCRGVIPALKRASQKLMEQKMFHSYFEAAISELIKEGRYCFSAMDTKKRFWGEIDFWEDYLRVEKEVSSRLVELAKLEKR